MKFNERIKSLRLQRSLTQQELGDSVGVSVLTIRNWESGVKSPSMSAIITLSQVLNVSSDYMLGIVSNPAKDSMLLSHNEMSLITTYRGLDTYGRKAVDSICNVEHRRILSSSRKKNSIVIAPQNPSRYIPRYITPSAAGYSVPLDGDDFEMILVDESVPDDADFAVSIQGNSMYPYINDGDVVYVKKNAELQIGDVGIFSVDGAMYCKQYYIDEARNLTLVSANPRLKHTNVYVDADSTTDVRCYGKVLLEKKIPLPDYLTV